MESGSSDDALGVVNELHQILAGAGMHANLGLPQIAVIGSQSVGKTSVLESLVGRDFLPRGSGIVTRRPLILQLQTAPADGEGANGPLEWAEFQHKPGDRFTDFAKVREEIERETERICGSNLGISDAPLHLRIYSPSVMDLTLVDLPGSTRVPTGSQPSDISERIRQLVLRYISPSSCLILAVSAANVDLATSDALALAREVDPQGLRTLGVLTKLDLAEQTDGAIKALTGHVYPLRLGYVGVVCRNQRATEACQTFEAAVRSEQEFLDQHRLFRHVVEQCGIPHLAQRLHRLLMRHVRETLPALRARIHGAVGECSAELASFGDPAREQRMGQGAFLLHLLSGYTRNFADALEGHLVYSQQEAPPDRLVGGARLHYIFHRVFARSVLDFDALAGLPDLEIRAAMRNAAGSKPQLFVPEVAFDDLVKRQIRKLEEPSLECVRLVYEELRQLAAQSEVAEMQRFNGFREKVLEVAHRVIRDCLPPTNQMVANIIKIELAHIAVDHPDFIGGSRAMSQVQVQTAVADLDAAVEDCKTAALSPQTSSPRRERGAQAPDSQAYPSAQLLRGTPEAGGEMRRNRWGDMVRVDTQLQLPSVPLVVTPSCKPSDKERVDTELLKSLIQSYFAIVKRKIIDVVPKCIMHFLVNAVRESLHYECVAEIYRQDLFSALLQEGEDVRRRRTQCQRRLEDLRRAQDVLMRIAGIGDTP